MKPFTVLFGLLAVIAALMIGLSCATLRHEAVACAATADEAQIKAALKDDDYEAALRKIGETVAACAVRAAVERIAGAAPAPGTFALSAAPAPEVAHARAWLAEHSGR